MVKAMETISITVNSEIAKAYRLFKPQRQHQFQMLMSVILKRSLEDIVSNLRNEAEANGLTPEILEQLLENG
jgi:hypothetical protein